MTRRPTRRSLRRLAWLPPRATLELLAFAPQAWNEAPPAEASPTAGAADPALELARSVVAGELAPGAHEWRGRRVWLKGGPLPARARWRHAARGWLLARPVPRVNELTNLAWLRERLFLAPEPLLAGVVRRGGPRFQFLVTAELPGCVTLRGFLESDPSAGERAGVLDELARELARMHAIHFVHRDLFPRNVLVGPREAPTRVAFLDAWAGGPAPGRRGPAYDLACLMLRGCELLDAREQRRLLSLYVGERAAQGKPVAARRLLARVRRERRALAARLVRQPARQRGLGPAPADWEPPVLD